MPFTKGHKLSIGNKGGGRKGYEYEREQLKKMEKIFSAILNLAEKIRKSRAKPRQLLAYQRLEKLALKIMDKLHASKQEQTLIGSDLPFTIKIVKDNGTTTTEPKREDSQVFPDAV